MESCERRGAGHGGEIPEIYESRDAVKFARRAVALGYYAQNGVSIGYCAQIAEMTEEEFIKYLGENHISVFRFDDKKEFLEEMENA